VPITFSFRSTNIGRASWNPDPGTTVCHRVYSFALSCASKQKCDLPVSYPRSPIKCINTGFRKPEVRRPWVVLVWSRMQRRKKASCWWCLPQ